MNKTISIHLGGNHFNVEEPAYEALSKYLEAIKRHFSQEEGRDEIMADIEARLAELLIERQDRPGSVFTLDHIESVIKIMGDPAEFGGEATENTPPPSGEQKSKIRRRVYRDTDSKVFGGVCSGFGYYFGIDPIWLRLAFVLFFLFGGSGFLFYLILWLIIPPARSTAEKLEMRGEAINIESIQRSIQDELSNLKSKISQLDNSTVKQRGRIGDIINDLGRLLLNLLQYLLQFISRFFGLILIVISVILLVGFISWLSGFGDALTALSDETALGFDTLEIARVVFPNEGLFQLTAILLAIVVVVPLLQFIASGVRILFKLDRPNPWIPRIGGTLTVVSILALFGIGASIFRDFRTRMPFTESVNIEADSTATLVLKSNLYDALPVDLYTDRPIYIDSETSEVYLKNVEFTIHPTATPENFVELEYRANAREKRIARNRAKQIEYPYDFRGAELEFKPYLILPPQSMWRHQEVQLTLFLREGQKVFIDDRMLEIIHDIPNVDDMYDGNMVDHYWIMTSRGLECMDCKNKSWDSSDL